MCLLEFEVLVLVFEVGDTKGILRYWEIEVLSEFFKETYLIAELGFKFL